MINNKTSLFGNPYPEPPSGTESLMLKPLSFFPDTLVLYPSVLYTQPECTGAAPLTWDYHGFLILPPCAAGSRRPLRSSPYPGFAFSRTLCGRLAVSPFHSYPMGCDRTDNSALGILRLLTVLRNSQGCFPLNVLELCTYKESCFRR